MIAIATMGKFAGPNPLSWDSSTGGGGEIRYINRKLPVVRIRKVYKKEIEINININNIKEE